MIDSSERSTKNKVHLMGYEQCLTMHLAKLKDGSKEKLELERMPDLEHNLREQRLINLAVRMGTHEQNPFLYYLLYLCRLDIKYINHVLNNSTGANWYDKLTMDKRFGKELKRLTLGYRVSNQYFRAKAEREKKGTTSLRCTAHLEEFYLGQLELMKELGVKIRPQWWYWKHWGYLDYVELLGRDK